VPVGGHAKALPELVTETVREGRERCGGAVVTVGLGVAEVESRLVSGGLRCPVCAGVLGPWGWARTRRLRDATGAASVVLRPRRSRCRVCGSSHVLLPSIALVRRADVVEVIGRALVAVAGGAGARKAAVLVGRPVETVRGWARRFRERAQRLRMVFTALLVDLAPDPVVPMAARCLVGDAVSAIAGAALATRSRWPGVVGGNVGKVPLWRFAAAVSHGRLLAPGWPPASSAPTG
jgi:hypothetical protein